LAVAALARIVWKAALGLASWRVPPTLLSTPRVTAAVQEDAEVLEALGTVPAAAEVAFVPP